MKVLETFIPYNISERNRIRFVFFGDIHLGHRLSSLGNFRRHVIDAYKDDPDTYFVDMGDGLDLIVAQTRDKRFKASQIDERYLGVDNPVDCMIKDYCKLLDPIKDRLLVMLDGNHHISIAEKAGTDPTTRIGYELWPEDAEKRLLGYAGFLVVRFRFNGEEKHPRWSRTRTLTFSLCHGIGTGGKTEAGFMTSLGQDAVNYIADVHCYGHNHRLAGWDRVKIGVDKKARNIISTKEIRLACGTYLKGLSDDRTTSYAEQARYKPNELGHMELEVRFTRHGEDIFWIKRCVQ